MRKIPNPVFLIFIFVTTPYFCNYSVQAQFKPFRSIESQILLSDPQPVNFVSKPDKSITEALVKSVVPWYLAEILNSDQDLRDITKGVSVSCQKDFGNFVTTLQQILRNGSYIFNDTSAWAVQMVDSWGKIPEGILSGHVNPMGDWHECVNVRSHPSIIEPFRGKHCFTYLLPKSLAKNMSSPDLLSSFGKTLQWNGVTPQDFLNEVANPLVFPIIPSLSSCMPSTCCQEDFQEILNTVFSNWEISPSVSYCGTDEKPDLTVGAICMIVILSILVSLIVIGTVLDTLMQRKENLNHLKSKLAIKVLIAFSLTTNIHKWADTSFTEGGFGCLHGIRVLSTCWVVLCHTLTASLVQVPFWNIIELNHFYDKHWTIYFILNGSFSVDTFFAMSGLLAAFSIMKALERQNGRLNPLPLYLHRYLRLTPVYAILLGIFVCFYEYLSSGAMFNYIAPLDVMNCRRYWWHNLLYINNFVWYEFAEGEEMCQLETWYLAYDMQFFILAPLFMILIYNWKIIGFAVLGTATAATVLIPGIYSGIHELPVESVPWGGKKESNDFIMKVTKRFPPYLVGLWMGYFLFKLKNRKLNLPKYVVIGGWLTSTTVALSILLGIIPFFDPKNEPDYVAAAFYTALSRFAWGVVICWIIFACSKGYGGWINKFLSWKPFIPLGRLTYCVYLLSLSVQVLFHSSMPQNMTFNLYYMVNLFFAHLVMCFLLSFVCTLAFEFPFIALDKILFRYLTTTTKKDTTQPEVTHPRCEDDKTS